MASAVTPGTTKAQTERHRRVQPLWLRITHWLNALGAVLMVLSGWRIYDASPLFGFRFPSAWTLGAVGAPGPWLGGALLWHFAVMWLLVINGLVYLALNVLTGRFRQRFLPWSPRHFARDLGAALRGRLAHDDLARYNAVQKAAYAGAAVLLIVLVLSGLVLWKSVQFPLLRGLMGGYESARVVHFAAMCGLVLFFVIHVTMVILVPRTLRAMITGR